MRSLLIACLGLSLSACNMVVTDTPMFDAADQTGPAMREGVWLAQDAECKVDTTKSVKDWPECADWFLLRDGKLEFPEEKPDLPFSGAIAVIVAGGDPQVWQMTLDLSLKPGEPGSQMNLYAGFEPLERDRQGRVIRYLSWPALCGPPPPEAAEGAESVEADGQPRLIRASFGGQEKNTPRAQKDDFGADEAYADSPAVDAVGDEAGEPSDDLKLPDLMTKEPFPGLTLMGKTGCKPDDEAALRNAVRASRAFTDEHEEVRWVKDGYP